MTSLDGLGYLVVIAKTQKFLILNFYVQILNDL